MGLHDLTKDLSPEEQTKALQQRAKEVNMPSLRTLAEGKSIFDGTIHDQQQKATKPATVPKVEVAKAALKKAVGKGKESVTSEANSVTQDSVTTTRVPVTGAEAKKRQKADIKRQQTRDRVARHRAAKKGK